MNCLIVDDEVLARDVIEHYVSKLDFLLLKGKCQNALEAFSKINSEKIDLIFLDIKMPEMNGLDLVKSLKHPPQIIITTAFHEYALEGYELDVVDYLLKPFSFDRFEKAVLKAKQKLIPQEKQPKEIYLKSNRSLIKISPADILYIEGLKNYLMVYTVTEEKRIIVHSTFKGMEEALAEFPYLIRIHKSFMVNQNQVKVISNNHVEIEGKVIPIGSSYKDLFLANLRK